MDGRNMTHETTSTRSNVHPYPRSFTPPQGIPAQHSATIAPMARGKALAPNIVEHTGLVRHGAFGGPADEFREIRTRLLALAGTENFVTLVVPVSSGSGGSYVARNLAAAFAFDEARNTVLIDCNLRRPSQDGALGISAAHGGLIDYLEQPGRGIQQVLYHTAIPRVQLIPAGAPRQWSIEYFASARMSTLIDSLRARGPNRYVFLDGPELKGSPDGAILANLADFVVIVAAYGCDTAGAINRAVAGLDPKKIAGVVFNHPR
jgi:Mrp family chromosome partitioning ATPase